MSIKDLQSKIIIGGLAPGGNPFMKPKAERGSMVQA